jgi:hypothetical protein
VRRPGEGTAGHRIRRRMAHAAQTRTLTSPNLFYCFVDFGKTLHDAPKTWVVPSEVVAQSIRDMYGHWLAAPGKNGQGGIAVWEFTIFRRPLNLANSTASPSTQCRLNRVSDRSLRKTGISQRTAGDFRRFRPAICQIRRLETACLIAKAANGGLFCNGPKPIPGPPHCLADLGGFELAHSRLRNAL